MFRRKKDAEELSCGFEVDIFLMGRKKLNILLSYSRLNRFRTRPKARWIELDTD